MKDSNSNNNSNNNYSVEFLPAAVRDISDILNSFIALGSKKGAVRIMNKINQTVACVSDFPYCGTALKHEALAKSGYRMQTVEKYLMFYRVFDNERKVVFYRVLNGERDYPSLLKNGG